MEKQTRSDFVDTAVAGDSETLCQSDPRRDYTNVEIGEFRFIARIGAGAFGAVWRANDKQLQRDVAVKVIRTTELLDVSFAFREAQAAARLQHPNIVQVFSVKQDDEHVYIVSELIEGENLLEQIRRDQLDFEGSAELCQKIAMALEHAHSQGIFHRDVKPSNILIDQNGTPYLTDFGIAKLSNVAATIRQGDQFVGSIGYMSPEQSRSENIDARSDIYSLGIVLYEMLTGVSPFSGTVQEVLLAHQYQPPSSLRSHNKSIPLDLQTICLKAISKRPNERYQSAQVFSEDLERYRQGLPILAKPPSVLKKVRRFLTQRSRISTVSAIVIAISSVGLFLLTDSYSAGPPKGFRTVAVKTFPPGSMLAVQPIDPFGHPDPTRKTVYSTVKTPTTLELQPGRYRFVAMQNGFPSAEVERTVPGEKDRQPLGVDLSLLWSEEANRIIKVPPIPLTKWTPDEDMVYIPGGEKSPGFFLTPSEVKVKDLARAGKSLPSQFEKLTYTEETPYWANRRVAEFTAEYFGVRLPTIEEIRLAVDYLQDLKDKGEINPRQQLLLTSLLDDIPEWTGTFRTYDPPKNSQVACFSGDSQTLREFTAVNSLSPLESQIAFRGARTARRVPKSNP